MNLTKHAATRKSQRGFSNFVLEMILQHGIAKNAPGGATKISFRKKEYQKVVGQLKKAIQLMDKAKGGHVIMKDGCVLTIYK